MVNNPPLDLAQEFPEHKDKIHSLKATNAHFGHLFDNYHDVNHQLNRIGEEIETVSDEVTENLKKQRLKLKDELLQIIHKAA